jgi:puromycin-sensitive aminopeptidase
VLLTERNTKIELPDGFQSAVVNEGGHGFYRVRYAAELRGRLLDRLGDLAAIERFDLVSDLLALCQAGLSPATEYLELTARFRQEADRNVWSVLIGSFAFVNRVIPDSARRGLATFVRDRLRPAAARLGWEPRPDESDLARQLRGDLIRALGTLGDDPDVQAEARARYARYRRDEAMLDPNVVPAVVATLAASGGEAEYGEFLERFRRARTPQEEQRYLYALAGFRQPELLRQTLDRTINGEIRSQDAPYVVRVLLSGVYGRAPAWEFVKTHWQTMSRVYPPSAYRRMFEGVTGLVSPEWEAEVRAFFPQNRIELGGKTLEQYLEQLRVAVRFRTREAEPLGVYLTRS